MAGISLLGGSSIFDIIGKDSSLNLLSMMLVVLYRIKIGVVGLEFAMLLTSSWMI
jgi:hypothetical protein